MPNINFNLKTLLGLVILLSCLPSLMLVARLAGATDNVLGDFAFYGWDSKYVSSSSPQGSPLGGIGLEYSKLTAGFHDINYFNVFGKWHSGVDLVPNEKYYENDVNYKKYNKIVMYSVCNGEAYSGVDASQAIYIFIDCDDKQHSVLYAHNEINYIPIGKRDAVFAGQPIAIMGSTGNSTGIHVHFAIKQRKVLGFVDPIPYIKDEVVL